MCIVSTLMHTKVLCICLELLLLLLQPITLKYLIMLFLCDVCFDIHAGLWLLCAGHHSICCSTALSVWARSPASTNYFVVELAQCQVCLTVFGCGIQFAYNPSMTRRLRQHSVPGHAFTAA